MTEINDLTSILPHSGRMLLLSKITGYNSEERSLEAEYHITENCLFFDSAIGGVPSWVGLECIAQAIASFSGFSDCEKSKKPRIGFILSISKMEVFIPVLKSGSTAVIKVKELDRTDSIYNFDGQIFVEGVMALNGTLTIMEAQAASNQRFDAAIISTSFSSTTEGSLASVKELMPEGMKNEN